MSKKVLQQEKVEMWELYQKCASYKKVAIAMNRSPDTVSKYVKEIDKEKKKPADKVIVVIQK
jgi:DNA-binding NarL/FixJ family response regulator